MSKWIIETNEGYVSGSVGIPIRVWHTKDINDATYRDLEEAKEWAGRIISQSLQGILYVRLIPLPDDNSLNEGAQ